MEGTKSTFVILLKIPPRCMLSYIAWWQKTMGHFFSKSIRDLLNKSVLASQEKKCSSRRSAIDVEEVGEVAGKGRSRSFKRPFTLSQKPSPKKAS